MDGSRVTEGAPKDFLTSKGIKFPKQAGVITGKRRGALRKGNYRTNATDAVLRVVRKDDAVVELGAGIGYLSALMATRRDLAALHCYEANPDLVTYIQSVFAANDLEEVELHNAVLGKRKGSAEFYKRSAVFDGSVQPIDADKDTPPEVLKIDAYNAKQAMKDATVLVTTLNGEEVDLIPELDLSGLRAAVINLNPTVAGPTGINSIFSAFIDAGLAYYARGSSGKTVAFRRGW